MESALTYYVYIFVQFSIKTGVMVGIRVHIIYIEVLINFLPFFHLFFHFVFFVMANEQDTIDIVQSADELEGTDLSDTVTLALQKVQALLVGMDESLQKICIRIEKVSIKQVLIREFELLIEL